MAKAEKLSDRRGWRVNDCKIVEPTHLMAVVCHRQERIDERVLCNLFHRGDRHW
jgi:hypothetical protein